MELEEIGNKVVTFLAIILFLIGVVCLFLENLQLLGMALLGIDLLFFIQIGKSSVASRESNGKFDYELKKI